MVEAAGTTVRYDQRLGNFYDRIAARRSPQKAKVAVAKEMLVIMWHMLTNSKPYRTMNRDLTERKYKNMERESRSVFDSSLGLPHSKHRSLGPVDQKGQLSQNIVGGTLHVFKAVYSKSFYKH